MNNKEKQQCKSRLISLARMPENWNGNGASSFSAALLNACDSILDALPAMPFISPTANDSIQMEYERPDGAYLEFEIFEYGVKVFRLDATGKHSTYHVYDNQDIAEAVNAFFASPVAAQSV